MFIYNNIFVKTLIQVFCVTNLLCDESKSYDGAHVEQSLGWLDEMFTDSHRGFILLLLIFLPKNFSSFSFLVSYQISSYLPRYFICCKKWHYQVNQHYLNFFNISKIHSFLISNVFNVRYLFSIVQARLPVYDQTKLKLWQNNRVVVKNMFTKSNYQYFKKCYKKIY